ncbi:hypothetical protein L1887_28351 [Cichorium endivia]|nr:hypothetical protein L1887_28351 [Cichorium endivia]
MGEREEASPISWFSSSIADLKPSTRRLLPVSEDRWADETVTWNVTGDPDRKDEGIEQVYPCEFDGVES